MWNKCGKCGRKLVGLDWDYGETWDCCDCAENKASVLHCETGCKVKVTRLNAGYQYDEEKANEYLVQDGIYTVNQVRVGRSSSTVYLQEVPHISFNTVHFERVV